MVYTPTVWKDRDVQNPRTYSVRENEDGTVTLFDAPGEIYEQGTPVNAANLNKIEEELTKKGGGLEIGDIGFAAFGINETLNERRYLNGQVISQSQFVSFTNKIKEAVALYPNIATTEGNWQAEVTNSPHGICGKFVIDDTLGTIRLPKYPDWSIREVGQAPVFGNGMTLGLTDGTNNAGLINDQGGNANPQIFSTTAYGSSVGDGSSGSMAFSGYKNIGVTTDPEKSGIIADLVNANTEDKLQGNWFIQVATGTEESVDVTREIELNNPFSLLDYKWSEYEITNVSWLISNGTFHSGATYVAVYELLLKIYNGAETKDGVSVKLSTEAYEDTDFVLNTDETTFRLPIKVKLASGNAVVGNGMTLGLTNGTQIGGLVQTGSGGLSCLYAVDNQYGANVGTSEIAGGTVLDWQKSVGVTTDPTKSGLVLADNDMYLYFYVGETIQDANVIAASQVLTKVANCIDRTVKSDRETVVGWGMPDYTAEVTISDINYTAPSDGFIFCGISGNGSQNTTINGKLVAVTYNTGVSSSYPQLCLPVSKGDVFKTNADLYWARFYPLKGVN